MQRLVLITVAAMTALLASAGIPALWIGLSGSAAGEAALINPSPADTDCYVLRADMDHNGSIDIADLTYLVAWLYTGGPPAVCPEEGDVDASGEQDISDLAYLVNYLFYDGPAPPILQEKDYVEFYRSMTRLQNSVALFFNLPTDQQPVSYVHTTQDDALEWLDEGTRPADPKISDFMRHYWETLSYGHLSFGVDAPRDRSGRPFVPEISGDPMDWGGLIKAYLDVHARDVWEVAGRLFHEGKRFIPSIVLVQHYDVWASADFYEQTHTVGGIDYVIGDVTHIQYDLKFVSLDGVPANRVREFWGILCHEYSHNFCQFLDLYGPQGCTGYWDLLGCHSTPGRMSEVCSHIKASVPVPWLTFKQVIEGPYLPTDLYLRPYTTTGDAIKVVPDPLQNPHEYFLLEYRKSTGSETWRPDGALQEEGLLITHINDRFGVHRLWLMRDAPFFDPEFADYSDNGGTLWTGHDRLNGILFPHGSYDDFHAYSWPNSRFYGQRHSGLRIEDIRIDGSVVRFQLTILRRLEPLPIRNWTVGSNDRCLAGRFSVESPAEGKEIWCRNDNNAALLTHLQAQWHVVSNENDWIGEWNLGAEDKEVVGDFDGDGLDEILIRSAEWAGILKCIRPEFPYLFNSLIVQHGSIGDWNLDSDDRSLAADLDGDGRDEVYVRSDQWAGVFKYDGSSLRLMSIQLDVIDEWNLGPGDREYIGRFTQSVRDEILIRSDQWIGIIYWDDAHSRLQRKTIEFDVVDDWNMGGVDKHAVGDFDGDGLDEIYIRSTNWAGLIKWDVDRLKLVWIQEGYIHAMSSDPADQLTLLGTDISYAGRFLPDRDCILHRASDRVALLAWESDQMKVRHTLKSPFDGRWHLGAGDKFVVGDFHRRGPDIGDPRTDCVGDDLDDIFIHNSWGTGMLGVNYISFGSGADILDEFGLTWINEREVLSKYGVPM